MWPPLFFELLGLGIIIYLRTGKRSVLLRTAMLLSMAFPAALVVHFVWG
jgi:hypothetical protein